jgi:SAM-dependent methyltransferase
VLQAKPICPLCADPGVTDFWQDSRRNFLRCQRCQLVFVPQAQHLSAREEKAEYDLHQNSPDDAGYRSFLARLAAPLLERLSVGSVGLDFGCGPGPTLSLIFKEAGRQMTLYDTFYAPDQAVFNDKYDFITATEVVEHLHRPGEELDRLWAVLRPGGWLGIMTKMVIDREAFAVWHYKNDLTHICFFCRQTFQWWAEKQGATLTFVGTDVVLLRK